MAQQSARAKPADTRINGAIDNGAINRMAPAIKTIQAYASDIGQMSREADVRAKQHIETLRKA